MTLLCRLLEAAALPALVMTVTVLPAPGKPFGKFAEENASCRDFARQQSSLGADQANSQVIASAVVGTLLGAGFGAALGGGHGAAIGAATGTLLGTGTGANGSAWSQMTVQQRYDIAYMQCMYAKGNQVPGRRVAAATTASDRPISKAVQAMRSTILPSTWPAASRRCASSACASG